MTVVAGMHLDGASAETTEAAVRKLCDGGALVAAGHCTGTLASQALLVALGSRGHAPHVGMQIQIDAAGRFELSDKMV